MVRTTYLSGAALLALLLLTPGCMGPVKQNVAPNPTPTAVPGGGSQQDYQGGMKRALDQQKGGR